MLRSFVLLVIYFLLNACAASGNYESSGPCKGFHQDQQACKRAAQNSLVILNVKIGQSPTQVREIMGKDPERREANADTETWGYLTDYMGELITLIIFKNNA